MKKKKILFIYYQLHNLTGINSILTSLVNLLAERYDITILLLMTGRKSPYKINENVTIIELNSFQTKEFDVVRFTRSKLKFIPFIGKINNYIYDLGVYNLVHQWLKENHQEYDIIITAWYKLSSYLATHKKIAAKTIAWEHIAYTTGGFLYQGILKRFFYQNLKYVVSITKQALTYYQNKTETHYIPNMANPELYNGEVKRFEDRKNRIVTIGRLMPEKNQKDLISAFGQSEIYRKGWSLRIIGEGPLREELEAQIKALKLENFIRLEGSKSPEEIHQFLNDSKIFAMTSRVEGMPISLIEAVAMGLPLVSYDTPTGPREIVTKKNGVLVEFLNQDKFVSALKDLTSQPNLLKELSKGAQESFAEYRPDKILKDWENIIEGK